MGLFDRNTKGFRPLIPNDSQWELDDRAPLGAEYTDMEREHMTRAYRRSYWRNKYFGKVDSWLRGYNPLGGWLGPQIAMILAVIVLTLCVDTTNSSIGVGLFFLIPRVPRALLPLTRRCVCRNKKSPHAAAWQQDGHGDHRLPYWIRVRCIVSRKNEWHPACAPGQSRLDTRTYPLLGHDSQGTRYQCYRGQRQPRQAVGPWPASNDSKRRPVFFTQKPKYHGRCDAAALPRCVCSSMYVRATHTQIAAQIGLVCLAYSHSPEPACGNGHGRWRRDWKTPHVVRYPQSRVSLGASTVAVVRCDSCSRILHSFHVITTATTPSESRAMGDDSITSETLSVYNEKRPFKSEAYLQKSGANGAPVAPRRNKTLKQILNQERDMFLQQRMAGEGAAKRLKTDDPGTAELDNMEVDTQKVSPQSVPTCSYCLLTQTRVSKPHRAYCLRKSTAILRGSWYVCTFLLQGNYTDPKTRLRYHSVEIYDIIKGFVRARPTYIAGAGSRQRVSGAPWGCFAAQIDYTN